MWAILKVFIESVTTLILLYVWFFGYVAGGTLVL